MIAEIPPPAYHESNTGNCSIRLREKILIRISHAISGGHRVAMASLFIGHRLLPQPFEKTMGLTCAIHSEPAGLAFAKPDFPLRRPACLLRARFPGVHRGQDCADAVTGHEAGVKKWGRARKGSQHFLIEG